MSAEAVMQNVDTLEARLMIDGSVGWSTTPVSPVTPLNVSVVLLPDGGTTMTHFVPEGTVMVLAPLASAVNNSWPDAVALARVRLTVVVPLGRPVIEPETVRDAEAVTLRRPGQPRRDSGRCPDRSG